MAELRAFRKHLQDAQRLAQQGCGFTPDGFCRAIFQHEAEFETTEG